MEDFVRSFEEDEEFGLNDINTKDFETGVDYAALDAETAAAVEAKRALHHAHPTVDHPTFVAKGMDDDVPGGAQIKVHGAAAASASVAVATVSDDAPATSSEEWYSTASLPLGWVALKPGEMSHAEAGAGDALEVIREEGNEDDDGEEGGGGAATVKTVAGRPLSETDRQLAFDPREEFAGARPGFVFRLGYLGVGYYEDRPPHLQSAAEKPAS